MSRTKAEVLIDIYSHAEYVVFGDTQIVIQIGAPCDATRALLESCSATRGAIITAWNPFSEERHPEENAAKNAELLAEIVAAGLRHLPAQGRDPNGVWGAEDSFLVLDAAPDQIANWLIRFEQNAAVGITRDAPATLILHERFRVE
jgi:hypothetical protein